MKKTLLSFVLALSLLFVSCGEQAPESVRNVIYMIGDGMGLAHVSMLQVENQFEPTSFDRAEQVALITTRSMNNRVTDSAAAGTALATGKKTNNSMLGQSPEGEAYESMIAKASKSGFATGLVVTCYLQHATPAAFYAHQPKRYMVEEITDDLLHSNIDLLVGGGRKWLKQECAEGKTYFEAFAEKGYTLADSLEAFEQVTSCPVLAAVSEKHLEKPAERGNYLPDAVRKSLELLKNAPSEKGFLVMVEGSQIDYAAHRNDSQWLLDELRDFDRAVRVAMDFADKNAGTLVVVVADHETGGLTLPAVDADFTQAENGVQYLYTTQGHSGSMVPVYLYGTGADRIHGVMDNTELSQQISALLGLE